MENPNFIDLLDKNFMIPSYKAFRNTVLPDVMSKLMKVIETKLAAAIAVCLMADLWSSATNKDFIAVAAITTNGDLVKEVLVLGMRAMEGDHCAEMVKLYVESIVNDYSFDKSKINGTFLL